MAIVYQHRRKDTNEIFYIGICDDHRKSIRPYSHYNRNKFWHNIVNKAGYIVEITHSDIIWEEACVIEKYLISFYGRRDLKTGILVNLTDGGEGVINLVYTETAREKMSKAKLGKAASLETRHKMSLAKKGKHNSEQHNDNIRKARIGGFGPATGKKQSPEHIAKRIASFKNNRELKLNF